MASNTSNLGLRKPAEGDNWSVGNDFNANMDKIDEFAGEMQNKLVISAASINALKNSLDSALAAMPNSGVKAFQVNFTVVEAPFTQASYLCTLYKSASNVTYAVATFRRIDQPIVIDGARNTNGWSFNSLSSQFANLAYKIQDAVQGNSSKTFDLTNKYPCLVSVGRNSTSSTGRLAFIDGWGGLVNLVTHATFNLSMSNGVLTVQNNGASYASVLIVHC